MGMIWFPLTPPCPSKQSPLSAFEKVVDGHNLKPLALKGTEHKLQTPPVETVDIRGGASRKSYVARLTSEKGIWAGKPHKYCPHCCRGEEVASQPLRSPCFPQLAPLPLPKEVEARAQAGRLEGAPPSVLQRRALHWLRTARVPRPLASVVARLTGLVRCSGSVDFCLG